MSDRGHRSIEHTADLAVELWAPDEATLLLEGATALCELLTEGAAPASDPSALVEHPVVLSAVDAEDRLVRWLSEVLYLASTEGLLFVDATLELSGAELRGTLRGLPNAGDRLRTEIKAVTYHDLHLERGPHGVRARIVFDV